MKSKSLIFTFLFFGLVLIIFIVIFIFWRIGILKKEPELSQTVRDLKNQIEFINNYPLQNFTGYLENLPTKVFPLPTVSPEEIGRASLF